MLEECLIIQVIWFDANQKLRERLIIQSIFKLDANIAEILSYENRMLGLFNMRFAVLLSQHFPKLRSDRQHRMHVSEAAVQNLRECHWNCNLMCEKSVNSSSKVQQVTKQKFGLLPNYRPIISYPPYEWCQIMLDADRNPIYKALVQAVSNSVPELFHQCPYWVIILQLAFYRTS